MTAPQNNKVTIAYINWILTCNRAIMGHLYQFTSAAGANDYFTDLDWEVLYNAQTWKANSLRIDGLHRKVAVGLAVDEQSIKVWASPTDTLFGSSFLLGAEQGLLDGATIVRYRAVWPNVTGNAAFDISSNDPVAVWPMFTGYFAGIDKGGASHVEMKVKSALAKLDIDMPRNFWQPGCLWTLFDSGCTLLKASFTVAGVVAGGPNLLQIPVFGGIGTPTGADGIANYAQGRLLFTSGVNNGLQVLINNNDSTNIYLAYPLDQAPVPGDTFNYWPGCSKSYNTCKLKFANENSFRGYDKVPPVQVSI